MTNIASHQIDVAFSVHIAHDRIINDGNIIVYDSVLTNNGGSYKTSGSAQQGKFIPPHNGKYFYLSFDDKLADTIR